MLFMRNLGRLQRITYILAILHILCIQPSHAEEEEGLDLDNPPDTEKVLTDSLRYGLEAQLTFEREGNFDLDNRSEDDIAIAEPQISLAAAYTPLDWLRGFLELELISPIALESDEDEPDTSTSLELNQAYIALSSPQPAFSAKIGRQSFQDARQWLYDEDLDAVRLILGIPRSSIDVSASRDRLHRRDLLNDDDDAKTNRYILSGRYVFNSGIDLNAYVLAQDERGGDNDDPVFFGVYSSGKLPLSLDYWLNAAYVGGKAEDVDIEAYGVDLGMTVRTDLPVSPSMTLGFAYGSGDNNPDDSVDHNFRQTGIQENEAAFGGVIAFDYYGEALAPELSNLIILAAGVGIRPVQDSSIDLVYHYYLQDEASDELRDANIESELNGSRRDIGHGLDLIAGGEFGDFELEFILGGFFPENAFSSGTDPAYFLSLEVVYEF